MSDFFGTGQKKIDQLRERLYSDHKKTEELTEKHGEAVEQLEKWDSEHWNWVVENILLEEQSRVARHAIDDIEINAALPVETLVKKARAEGQYVEIKELLKRKKIWQETQVAIEARLREAQKAEERTIQELRQITEKGK